MSFEENFLYPLILILIAGLITGILIPTYNRMTEKRQKALEILRHEKQLELDIKREDHQKELEIKSEIVKKISEIHATAVVSVYGMLKEKPIRQLVNETYLNWFREKNVTTSQMEAYFGKSEISDKWDKFSDALGKFWGIFHIILTGDTFHEKDFQELKTYFEGKADINWNEFGKGKDMVLAWTELNKVIANIKDEIIQNILKEKVTAF